MKKINIKKMMGSGLLLAMILFSSCEKYLEIPLPDGALGKSVVFSDKNTIKAAADGMYSSWSDNSAISHDYVKRTVAMSDEGYNPNIDFELQQEMNAVFTDENGSWSTWWRVLYKTIFKANMLLENLPEVPETVLTAAEKNSYLGAALTVRSTCYYYLATSFGDVPLVISTDVMTNKSIGRTPVADVFKQITSDLETAISYLPEEKGDPLYVSSKFIPEAFLARVYLYLGNWAGAEKAATDVIANGGYSMVADLTTSLMRGSDEIISAMSNNIDFMLATNRTWLGWNMVPGEMNQGSEETMIHLSDQILNSFETGDLRRDNWVINKYGYLFSNKYIYPLDNFDMVTGPPQDYVFLRLAEQHLIRAEARAQLNNTSGATADLNVVRNRAGLTNTTAAAKAALLTAIEKERLTELFWEGFRWNDLVRTNQTDAKLGTLPYKSGNWKSTNKLLPIPLEQIRANPELVQNPGY